jgi:hypothetical protein
MIIGIDPGQQGYFAKLWHDGSADFSPMPLKGDESKDIDFETVKGILSVPGKVQVILERAMPMAMGSKHAFNYGRGFAAIEIAIKESGHPVLYVEPAKWMKELFDGIDSRLRPKAQALIAAERLLPSLFEKLPRKKTGKPHEGAVDALLIAEYGRRKLGL